MSNQETEKPDLLDGVIAGLQMASSAILQIYNKPLTLIDSQRREARADVIQVMNPLHKFVVLPYICCIAVEEMQKGERDLLKIL